MHRNAWYIACASCQLGTAPVASRVFDLELVVFRDAERRPHALMDRCCHRGVQLTLGTVQNGQLVCRYHGWRYDGDGRCVQIPSLPKGNPIPPDAKIRSYPCVERDGYVWVWLGGAAATLGQPMPIAGFNRFRWRQGVLPLGCGAGRAIENNLDWVHPYFTHPWSHGQFFSTYFRGFHDQQFEMRLTNRGLLLFAPPNATADAPLPDKTSVRIEFTLPDRVSVAFLKPLPMVVIMHFVPTGPNTCRQEWLMTRMLPFGQRTRWTNRTPRVFAQDQTVLESAQPWYDRQGEPFELSVPADAPTLLIRQILALSAAGSWDSEKARLTARRVVTVRA